MKTLKLNKIYVNINIILKAKKQIYLPIYKKFQKNYFSIIENFI